MKKRLLPLLCCALLLSGCGAAPEPTVPETTAAAVVYFPDGDPETVTCLGSYTVQDLSDAVVAKVGERTLTNRELQAWYWAEVARLRSSGEPGPDFDQPLDLQACPAEGVTTWQQYFLREALNTWHTAQALIRQSEDEELPLEEAYKPYAGTYEKYMDGMPATEFLYGYHKYFRPNTMHQEYLDALPEHLNTLARELGYASAGEMARNAMGTDEKSLLAFAQSYNYAYMYFTTMNYHLTPLQEEIEAQLGEGSEGEALVDFRHILCADLDEAKALLKEWSSDWRETESTFGQLAHDHSQDPGSASEGGLYRRVTRSQIPRALADWCFALERVPGETTVLESEHGAHVVYFVQRSSTGLAQAERELLTQRQQELMAAAREKYPMEVTYGSIALIEAEGTLDKDALLYADFAHERFPEVPLYLQQDYPGTMYGGFTLRSNGCGITSFAMLATYLADEELTPPEMCAMFGRYSSDAGTDGGIFARESAGLGCYVLKRTWEWREAKEYLQQGYLCVVLQREGYWTTGGHYLVLEEIDENDMVRVRDSNLYNYFRVREGHSIDSFPWNTIIGACSGFWVFDYKDVTNPACTRCGTPEGRNMCTDYFCAKCEEATQRRSTYLMGI